MAKEIKDAKTAKNPRYSAEDIYVLEGLEPVRKRPGMYIGSTGPDGLHHLVWEIFDNSRDEAMGGFASEIEVALLPGNVVRVADDGRGIPVDIHPKTKVSALETTMTTLHAGGKFSGESYKISGGLHGVGASVVNALSSWLKAEVHRDGGKYMQEYKQGKPKAKVKKVGSSKSKGTIITFTADPEIFSATEFDFEKIKDHHRQQAYLVKKLKVRILDAREYKGKIDDEMDPREEPKSALLSPRDDIRRCDEDVRLMAGLLSARGVVHLCVKDVRSSLKDVTEALKLFQIRLLMSILKVL